MSAGIHAPIGELSIAVAQDQRAALLAALAEDGPQLQLDLGHIEACDSAGVQLLLALQRSTEQRGRRLHITAASSAVQQALATYGLGERLLGTTGEGA